MKKKMPAALKPKRAKRDDHVHDEATRHLLEAVKASPVPLDKLKPTQTQPVGPQSPFAVLGDVPAIAALRHVSMLLKSTEEVSDEITEYSSGIERGLIWSMVHSVEMARSLVDALLKSNGIDPEQAL
ncbi:MAG: hypothetical protein V4749_19400 [Pseudomonadota bacterium]